MSSEVQIAVIDQQDTQIVLAVPGVQGATGSEIAAGGTANQVLRKASSTNYDTNWSLVTNAMVDSSAAIAGTKISPDFGSQNSVTTGTSTAASFIPTSSTAPTNGVYLPSANNVAISTNGTGRLFVDASGRVGIGGSPSALFHLTQSAADAVVRIDGGSSNSSFIDFRIAGANKSYVGLGALTGGSNNDLINYNSSAGNWIAYTNSTERMRLDSSGRLGLGTSSVGTTFHAVGGNVWSSNFYEIGRFQKSSGTGVSIGYDNTAYVASIGAYSHDGTASALSFWTYPGSGTAQERVRITPGGAVGIGTTTVQSLLHLSTANLADLRFTDTGETTDQKNWVFQTGTSVGAGVFRLRAINDANTDGQNAYILTKSGTSIQTHQWLTAGSERARIDSSGRLLVGTSTSRSDFVGISPRLQVEGTDQSSSTISAARNSNDAAGPALLLAKSRGTTAGAVTVVQNNDLLGGVYFMGADGTNVEIGAQITGEVDGAPGNNDLPTRLVFSTTADGASSPTSRLVIKESGDIVIPATSATAGFWIGTGDSAGNAASANYRFGQNSTGIGSATFYIGNAAIQVSSDVRLKENIEDTKLDALNAISQIKVKDFTWNDPSDTSVNNRNARGKWTGLIAQELVEILPFVVNAPRKEEDNSIDYESEDRWLLDQSQLCPVLIKAIQQQQEIIVALEARLSALEGV